MTAKTRTDPAATIYGTFVRTAKRRIDMSYDYEHAQICTFLRAGEIIKPTRMLDIGANVGLYTVLMAELPTISNILSLEPSQETYDILKQNIALQPRAKIIEPHMLALSDEAGTAEFAEHGNLCGNNGLVTTEFAGSLTRDTRHVVKVVTSPLDAILATRNETFIAKIDVEGHECQVIGGAKEYLTANRGLLQIECFRDNTKTLHDAMEALGYDRVFRMNDDYYFTNIEDPKQRAALQEMMLEEVANALEQLKVHKRQRRATIRAARATFDTIKYGTDPVAV